MLTKQSEDFAKWYNEVVLKTDLAEYSPVKGCMIIKPYGYAMWENIQKNMDAEIKKLGVNNVYFPLFIPERFFKKEADGMAKAALNMYRDFVENWLGIFCVVGKKTEAEKFAGTLYTLSVEALMKDGKALQMGTSHNLGQNFAKAFNIKFLDKKGRKNYVWQTSWGVSTRMIGGLVMAHGDDKGLVLPPKVAPYQVVIIPITFDTKTKSYIAKIEKTLFEKSIRFYTDASEHQTPGWKFHEWELKGAPLRIEIGPKEVKENKITFVLRDELKRSSIPLKQFEPEKLLDAMQKRLLKKSEKFTLDNTFKVKSYEEFKKILKEKNGFVRAHWCGDNKCEKKIQDETKATIRCILSEQKNRDEKCVKCGQKSEMEVLFAKAY